MGYFHHNTLRLDLFSELEDFFFLDWLAKEEEALNFVMGFVSVSCVTEGSYLLKFIVLLLILS